MFKDQNQSNNSFQTPSNISINPFNKSLNKSSIYKINRTDKDKDGYNSPVGSPSNMSSFTGLLSNKYSTNALNKHKSSYNNNKSSHTLQTNESNSSLIIKKN